MNKTEILLSGFLNSGNQIEYVLENSCLPGKRGNLELLYVVMDVGNEPFFLECLAFDASKAPTNTPGEFACACGAAGLGQLISKGNLSYYEVLRKNSNDIRWRVREGVAFALQYIGDRSFEALNWGIREWINGTPYEKRAVVAGLCEPKLLIKKSDAKKVLEILEEILGSVHDIIDRKSDAFIALKKGLGYGLSVVIASLPAFGKEMFERFTNDSDRDIHWILRENLKKNRLKKMDATWVDLMQKKLG